MNKDRLLSDEEQLEQAINSLFMVGYDIGRTAKIILSAEDLRSHLENNAITDRQKVDMAANPHKDKLLHIINTQKRLYAEMIIDIDTDVDIPEALKKIYSDGYSNGHNDRTYENSYNSFDSRMAEAIAPAVAKVRSRYDKQLKALEEV